MTDEGLFDRLVPLLGEAGLERLQKARILVVGVGGVGSFAVEALARSGVGGLTLVDGDTIRPSNTNRQLHATKDTFGKKKALVMKDRVQAINPACEVRAVAEDFTGENAEVIFATAYDYVFDATDDIPAKVLLAVEAKKRSLPLLSSAGQGNRLYAEDIRITDLFETEGDPLARKFRKHLRKEGVTTLETVFCFEKPEKKRSGVPSSSVFVPPVAGMRAGGHMIRKITGR